MFSILFSEYVVISELHVDNIMKNKCQICKRNLRIEISNSAMQFASDWSIQIDISFIMRKECICPGRKGASHLLMCIAHMCHKYFSGGMCNRASMACRIVRTLSTYSKSNTLAEAGAIERQLVPRLFVNFCHKNCDIFEISPTDRHESRRTSRIDM